ncbi:hypothetical protein JRQ81_007251 [Phrynocephalus forsythii]|uniref:Capsid protein n=1 Tax=Phrynocephalus forsythii TaxID=171643 RepID=A0A9Q1ATY6_9SAUR|nr:hypothetical protein JRQ81_007251 [Phrynocephalus forsythii]
MPNTEKQRARLKRRLRKANLDSPEAKRSTLRRYISSDSSCDEDEGGTSTQRSLNMDADKWSFMLHRGFYRDIHAVLKEMNDNIKAAIDPPDMQLVYDAVMGKVKLSGGNKYKFSASEGLAHILGVPPNVPVDRIDYAADITGGFSSLYVYTDIIEHQIVGDSSVPLLHCIPVRGETYEWVTVTYDKPHYMLMSKNHINTITIEIKTDQNQDIQFNLGKVVVRSNIANYAKTGLVNYPIASLFSQLDVTLGDRLISQSNNCYPYRAIIELLLNYGTDTLSTQFEAGGFYKDAYTTMEATLLGEGGNWGFRSRAVRTAASRKWDLMEPLHRDLFFQDKMLLNGVDVKIKLTRSKDEFCLMSGDDNEAYAVNILNASLFVKRVKVSPSVHLGHSEALLTSNAKYPVERVGMKVFSIAAGSLECNQENLFFLGQLPKKLVIGFVENAAFSGGYTNNPFNFKHFNVNFVALYVDGVQVPAKPLQPDFANGICVREYM